MSADKPLTGRTVLAIAVAAFGVVIAVNLVMAALAVGTFPGTDTANSYVASQVFDRERRAQEALGWRVRPEYAAGRLTLHVTDREGRPVPVAELAATVGRPTHGRDDVVPDFAYSVGRFDAALPLAPGVWHVRLEARAYDGTPFRQRLVLHVREGGA